MTVCGIKQADGVCVMGECPHFKKCCPVVWDKSGEPMTNEEWFCSLSTTEKAEFLSTMAKKAESISWWDDWLKEKHESEGSDVSVR